MSITVSTSVYEGPFDLLLNLILKEEVELYEVSLSAIVDAYLTEMESLDTCDLEAATEFLLIASILVELKTRRLLPVHERAERDDEFGLWEERDLLLARLLECKTFKDAAVSLRRMAADAALSRPRRAGLEDRFAHLAPDLLEGVTTHDLRTAFMAAMAPRPSIHVDTDSIAPIRISVAEAVALVANELPARGVVTFRHLTRGLVDRIEVVEPHAKANLLALWDVIQEQRAAIDVFAEEPTTVSPLFGLPGVIVTPHLGASTVEAQDKAGITIAEQVELALAGDYVPFAVNVDVGEAPDEIRPFVPLAEQYAKAGADELVFYDITASSDQRVVDKSWVSRIAQVIDIPFCVAGGIKSVEDAGRILEMGADKISINSPALSNPELINELHDIYGQQCVVIGIDSFYNEANGRYDVYKFTGDESRTQQTQWHTIDWIKEVQSRGAGEIVLNCMNQDGVRKGYDIEQLKAVREVCKVPLIASGGAGAIEHFTDVFKQADVDGALAASVFHKGIIDMHELKDTLASQDIPMCIRHRR